MEPTWSSTENEGYSDQEGIKARKGTLIGREEEIPNPFFKLGSGIK